MSPCPKCGAKGKHLFVLASFETALATVQHRCTACGLEWSEEAREPVAAVRSALRRPVFMSDVVESPILGWTAEWKCPTCNPEGRVGSCGGGNAMPTVDDVMKCGQCGGRVVLEKNGLVEIDWKCAGKMFCFQFPGYLGPDARAYCKDHAPRWDQARSTKGGERQ